MDDVSKKTAFKKNASFIIMVQSEGPVKFKRS